MRDIAGFIDHTILRPDASKDQVLKICQEAKKYNFASVCVNPYYVKLVDQELKDSDVKITCVVGFPLGANTSSVKEFETKEAIADGANEIDMVINIAALKDRQLDVVKEDIEKVVKASGDNTVKVIIEA